MRVVGTKAFGKNVINTCCLENCTSGTSGNNTRTCRSRLHQQPTGTKFPLNLKWYGVVLVDRNFYQIFLRLLSRPPSVEELDRFTALLTPGYDTRLTGEPPASPPPRNTKAVSWANHLNPEATNAVLAIEKEVQAGSPPTSQLRADWRERCEDALWALMVSPEFIAVP